jgi:hypothetical protein
MAPILELDLLDHDMGVRRVLAEHAHQRVGERLDDLGLLLAGRTLGDLDD